MFEIGSNRTAFKVNSELLNKQNKNLRKGLRLIFSSAISLALIFIIQTININSNKMADKNQDSENQSNQNDSDTGREIPEVRPEQTTYIEKGGNPNTEKRNK